WSKRAREGDVVVCVATVRLTGAADCGLGSAARPVGSFAATYGPPANAKPTTPRTLSIFNIGSLSTKRTGDREQRPGARHWTNEVLYFRPVRRGPATRIFAWRDPRKTAMIWGSDREFSTGKSTGGDHARQGVPVGASRDGSAVGCDFRPGGSGLRHAAGDGRGPTGQAGRPHAPQAGRQRE